MKEYDEIRVLAYPECIRLRWPIYISGPEMMLREAIDNSTDEFLSHPTSSNNLIVVDNINYGGYNLVCDRGRGIPIQMSKDYPNQCQADIAVSTMHAGSKFDVSQNALVGMNGVGISATNALSEKFIILSKITQENYDKSLKCVKDFYEKLGPRSKKEVFYYAYFECGYKKMEGAAKKKDIEIMLGLPRELPEGMSTMVLFKVDTTIFPNPKTEIPLQNLENFLFIQEKFYKRSSIKIMANDQILTSSGFQSYKFEILRTITPADPSVNPYLGIYATFEIDKGLSPKHTGGSVNGLVCDSGAHINAIEKCYEEALKLEYKINHKTIFPGLKMKVILLAEDLMYDTQTKSRLKSITKVKQSDFSEITKEFQKIFRKNDDYWRAHVEKLNALAESYKSIGAVEKAQKMIDASRGNSSYRMKGQNYVEGFSDATSSNRWDCELFLCFSGDTEVYLERNERIKFIDLVRRIENGDELYTYSCDPSGEIKKTKIIAAKEIDKVNTLCKIILEGGDSFKCTPDHKIMMNDGIYKEAKDLKIGDLPMPFYGENLDLGIDVMRGSCYEILNTLRKNSLKINRENYNNEIIKFMSKPTDDEEMSRVKIDIFGYDSAKTRCKDIFKMFETKKVIGVEIIETEDEPVYCLEVDSPEHNFPLATGIFVKNCEGLSAGGSLKSGRKSTLYHAVLPLRGKILNVKDATVDEALANKEIFTMLSTIGLGIDINFVGSKCSTPEETYEEIKKHARYNKIVISTDSDSDGSHIQNLILYCISKYARFLIDYGMVYILQSPLYEQGGKFWFPGDTLQPGTNFPVGLDLKKHFRRFKGLGSIPKELIYDSFYNPSTRRLIQVTPDGIDYFLSLVEDIDIRKDLLVQSGILGDPYNLSNV